MTTTNRDQMLLRMLDILASAFGLLLLAPLLLVLGLIIKVSDRGPAFYRAHRVGKNGEPFYLLKFRSMVIDAAHHGPGVTVRGDSRITRIGGFLRRSKLDELPQLLNVLRGEMSLVGPRPEDPRYVAHYTPEERAVLSVRPGITSAATICYRDEETLLEGKEWEKTYLEQVMREKLAIDMQYLAHRSLFGDINIILHTFLAIFHCEPSVRFKAQPLTLEMLLRQVETPARLGRFVQVRWLTALTDSFVVTVALWVALLLRFDGAIPIAEKWALLNTLPVALLVYLGCIRYAGLYRVLWHYAGAREIWRIAVTSTIATLLLVAGILLLPGNVRPIPLSVLLSGGVLATLGLTVVRYRKRLFTGAIGYIKPIVGNSFRRQVLLVGAGEAGSQVGQTLAQRFGDYEIVGYVDDDPRKHGKWLGGTEVLGGRGVIQQVVEERGVELIIVALHHVAPSDYEDILQRCQETSAEVRVLDAPSGRACVSATSGPIPMSLPDRLNVAMPTRSAPFGKGRRSIIKRVERILVRVGRS
jgi:lipopolysaccharide/colanic/teichoic acid biosynthesis glycosyltransferase